LEAAAVLIRLWIEGSQPLTGTAVTEGREPLRFHGWLELLTVVSELVAAAPTGDEDADTDERDNPGESDGEAGRLHHEPPTSGPPAPDGTP
jgi:hypothetical protein